MRDDRDVVRIELHVRIALRMDVTHGAIEFRRHLQQPERRRGLEVACGARLDARVARLLDEHRQPADFEFGAGGDHQVRAARTRHQAGLGLDAMHVLQRGGGHVDVDAVTAKLGGECAPVGRGGEYLEGRLRGQRARDHQQD